MNKPKVKELRKKRDTEIRFAEDDEEMLVIKGGSNTTDSDKRDNDKTTKKKPKVEEFTLCDYYLVHGNKDKFQIYPFVKKRGKRTEDIGRCVLDYDAKKEPLTFTYDIDDNIQQLARNVKAQAVVSFCAALSKKSLRGLITSGVGLDDKASICLFDFLKGIESTYKNRSEHI